MPQFQLIITAYADGSVKVENIPSSLEYFEGLLENARRIGTREYIKAAQRGLLTQKFELMQPTKDGGDDGKGSGVEGNREGTDVPEKEEDVRENDS